MPRKQRSHHRKRCARCGAIDFSPLRGRRPGRRCNRCGAVERLPVHVLSQDLDGAEGPRHLYHGSLAAAVDHFRRRHRAGKKLRIVARTQSEDGKFRRVRTPRARSGKPAALVAVESGARRSPPSSTLSAGTPLGYAPLAGTLFIQFPEQRFASDATTGLGLGYTNENLALTPALYQVTLDGPKDFHADPTPAQVNGGAVTTIEMYLDA